MALENGRMDVDNVHNIANKRLGRFMYSLWNYTWELIKANNNNDVDKPIETNKNAIEFAFIGKESAHMAFKAVEIVFVDNINKKILGSLTVNCGDDDKPDMKEVIKVNICRPPDFRWLKRTLVTTTEKDL